MNVFLLQTIICTAVAQQPELIWTRAFRENNQNNPSVYSNGRSVAVDAQGNVYSAGLFSHSIDFDPGPGVFTMIGGDPFGYGIYLSKLDPDGKFLWALQVPTRVEFGQIEIEVDKSGNVYLSSDLMTMADMDPGPGVLTMSPTGFRDAFITKYDPNGSLIWAKQIGGPGDTGSFTNNIEIDPDDNIILTGTFNNTQDFDPGPGVYNIKSAAHMQCFIVKLNKDGGFMWAKQFGNGQVVYHDSYIYDFKIDVQGNIFATGSFSGICDFDPGAGSYMMTSSPGSINDGFVCKLDRNGNFVWAKSIGQDGGYNHYMNSYGIDVDLSGNVIVTGGYLGNFDFDPGPSTYYMSGNPGNCFILKLNSEGIYIWAKTIGSNSNETGNDIVTDNENNIYIVGSFGTKVDFDPGPGEYWITSANYGSSALVKLNQNGEFVYAAPFHSINYGTSLFRRMAIDQDRNIYVTGSMGGSLDFDPGPGVFELNSGNYAAPFVVKLGSCKNITRSTLDILACNNYTLNNITYDSSGTYRQTIKNSTGCDSVITLNLMLQKKLVERTETICTGLSFYVGGADRRIAGIYYDTLKTTMGCDSVVRTKLVVNPVPQPDLGNDRNVCKGSAIILNPGRFTNYLWQDGSSNTSFEVTARGLYWVTVANEFNCQASDSFRVADLINPPADFLKPIDSTCANKSIELNPTRSYNSYSWSTGSIDRTITVKNAGIYSLTVTDAAGCKGSDTVNLYTKQCITAVFFPNAFTPDNDGKNDLFRPVVFGDVSKYRFTVYNRWGAIVFQTTDSKKGWDGRMNGIIQGNTIYIWTCSYQLEDGPLKNEKGTVLLIR